MGIDATAVREEDISHFPVRFKQLVSDADIRLEYAIPCPTQGDSSFVLGGIALFLSIESVVNSLDTSLSSSPRV
jgi:hypothetical protein